MIEPFIMLALIATAVSVAYYVRHKEAGKYIWLGSGKDPFRRR